MKTKVKSMSCLVKSQLNDQHLYKSENWLNYASRSTSNDNKVIEKTVQGAGFDAICSTMVELHYKLAMDKNW